MNFYYKCIKCLHIISVITLLLPVTRTIASECGVMQLKSNRSTGVTVKQNKCDTPPYIALGTVVDLSANGRLWLKSNQSPVIGSAFQLICQNKTSGSFQIEFSEMLTPWLNQEKLNNCSGWIDNKLDCKGNMGEKNGLYCVLTFDKAVSKTNKQNQQMERTTSVKIRGVGALTATTKTPDDEEKQEIVDTLKSDIALCKQLNKIPTTISVNWIVNNNAEAKKIQVSVKNNTPNRFLTECIETVINTYQFPLYSTNVSFKSTY